MKSALLMSIDEWMGDQSVACPHNAVLFGLKKEGNLSHDAAQMTPEDIVPSEGGQSQKDRCSVVPVT